MNDIASLLTSETSSYTLTSATIVLGDTPLTVYARPVNGADIQYVTRKHPTFSQNPTPESMVELLIRKAVQEDGTTKVFSLVNKDALMRVKTDKLNMFFADLFKGQFDEQTDEDAETRLGN
jgi:hypothetical protein